MATRGVPGQLLGLVRGGDGENARLGQAFVLFGLLSVVGGVGLFVLTETFRFEASAFLTYRRAAGGLAGYGLPAFLYGLVVAMGGDERAVAVGVVGVLLSATAVFAFLSMYPDRWDVATSPALVVGALAVYGVGAMLGSFAAGGAMLARIDEESDDERETGFVWGEPPEG